MSEFILVTEYDEPNWQILVSTDCIEKVTQRMYDDGPATYLCRRGGHSPLRIRESVASVITLLTAPVGRPWISYPTATPNGWSVGVPSF